jgi:hypothetical protein
MRLQLSHSDSAFLSPEAVTGTHLKPPTTHQARLRSEVVDLTREGTTRGIEKGPQSLLTKDVGELILELPPLSPEGGYRVTLQSENGQAMVSGAGIAKTQNGKTELPVMNLRGTIVRQMGYDSRGIPSSSSSRDGMNRIADASVGATKAI